MDFCREAKRRPQFRGMSSELTERQALLVLNALPNIGPITLNRLLADLGNDPRAVFTAGKRRLESVKGVGPVIAETIATWTEHLNLAREEERMAKSGADFITTRDDGYPRLLKEIHDPPIGLYRRGRYDFAQPCVAIVGSRRTTIYGQATAKKLGAELARLRFCVVSGLALFATGCPGPADLDHANDYLVPPAAGSSSGGSGATAGTSGSGGSGMTASCLTPCVTAVINATGTGCKTCHGVAIKLAGTLDMETAGLDARLKDKPAEHPGLPAGTACPSGDKLIDSATPANSWLLKKVTNMQASCGTVMPSSGVLSAADQACFTTYVNCVAGAAAP